MSNTRSGSPEPLVEVTPDAAPSRSQSHANNVESALGRVVIALIPVAFAYFIGWAYLYYYLIEFGINVSELDLGVEAVIIYAAPPILSLVKRYWWAVALAVIVVGVLMAYQHLIRWPRPNSHVYLRIQSLRPLLRFIRWPICLVLVVLALAPLIKDVATRRADEKWTRTGIRLHALVEESSDDPEVSKDYKACMERRALDFVFADKNVYYLLCVSEINDASGVVYEVRRSDSKLGSVRWSHKSVKSERNKS